VGRTVDKSEKNGPIDRGEANRGLSENTCSVESRNGRGMISKLGNQELAIIAQLPDKNLIGAKLMKLIIRKDAYFADFSCSRLEITAC
jgi:hypothetical protein